MIDFFDRDNKIIKELTMKSASTQIYKISFSVAAALLVVLMTVFVSSPAPSHAASVGKDSVKEDLLALPEIDDIADNLNVNPEVVANDLVAELGVQATADLANYVANNDIDVNANLAEAKEMPEGQMGPINPQKTCAKSIAAASLFSIWGGAICSAAAVASVGAAGIPCTVILTIGSSSLDWGKVCD